MLNYKYSIKKEKQQFKDGDIVRYGKGRNALMRVDRGCTACGHLRYEGKDIYGDYCVKNAENCINATLLDKLHYQQIRNAIGGELSEETKRQNNY